MRKVISKSKGLAKVKSTMKVAKTFKGTNVPYFEVIVPETTSSSGLFMWGVGETKDITILTHLNNDYNGVNRIVKNGHKKVVGEAILKYGYACGIAICIFNGKLYRVDGNHRAEVLSESGHPIRFVYRTVNTLQELIDIMIGFNNSAKNWGIDDYINTHTTMGVKAFVVLKDMLKYGLTPSVTASLVANVSIGLAKKQIRSGELTCLNKKAAEDRVKDFKGFLTNINSLDQRPAEGLLYFLNTISFTEFRRINHDLADRVVTLITKENALLGNGTPSARAYEKVFVRAYNEISYKFK